MTFGLATIAMGARLQYLATRVIMRLFEGAIVVATIVALVLAAASINPIRPKAASFGPILQHYCSGVLDHPAGSIDPTSECPARTQDIRHGLFWTP
jgi:hypothetical protein